MKYFLITGIIIMAIICKGQSVLAQTGDGDQFLDGIGETALIARYVLAGDLNDWSRNALHAEPVGSVSFVTDERFGQVLALPTGSESGYVKLPGHTFNGCKSISITGWLWQELSENQQGIFKLGHNADSYISCIQSISSIGNTIKLIISNNGSENGPVVLVGPIADRGWLHLAFVLDVPGKKARLFINGKLADSVDIKYSLTDILSQDDLDSNQMFLGLPANTASSVSNGLIHDIRFYNIPLTNDQIAMLSGQKVAGPTTETQPDRKSEVAKPHLLIDGLIAVPDIQVNTTVGNIPELPLFVTGVYEDNAAGSLVRVIWPFASEFHPVDKQGKYIVAGTVPGSDLTVRAEVMVNAAQMEMQKQKKLAFFALGQVTLDPDSRGSSTPFIRHRDKFINTLAGTNPDNFLYNFRDAFGQSQPSGVKPLGVWDSQTTKLRGHATGHYLSALAQAYASTGYDKTLQDNFRQKMDYMISILYELSQMSGKPAVANASCNSDPVLIPIGPGKSNYNSDLSKEGIRTDYWNWGKGFISGYPPDQFIMLEHGASYGGGNDQVWAPYYTLHKILAGLLDCYEVGNNAQALEIAQNMAGWVYQRLSKLSSAQRSAMWDRYIAGEYGGMNEVMARLYLLTGKSEFMECAGYFDNVKFFFGDHQHSLGLACNYDTIGGRHANQHIPQITGALEYYLAGGDLAYYKVAVNFWKKVTGSYSYSIGGVAGASNPNNAECFTAVPDSLFVNGFSVGGQNETCATYNMLKLSRLLFLFEQKSEYMDYYERALYNHILASVDKDDPGNTYHVPLNPGAYKSFSNARMDGFTCCNGTAIESGTKLQDSIYFRSEDDSALYVNLYISSTLNWHQKGITLSQNTDLPYSDEVKLIVSSGSGSFALFLRVPYWSVNGFTVSVNGNVQQVDVCSGSYLKLERLWQQGDVISLQMPMSFHLMPVMDRPDLASVFYGPVLLAVQESEPLANWRKLALDLGNLDSCFTGDPASLTFTCDGLAFKPFYESYGCHSVYLDIDNIAEK